MDNISHCYVVANEQEDFAIEFAKLMFCSIFCKNNPTCFTCEDCIRAASLYNSNIEVYPKENKKLDVSAIDEIIFKCSLKANESGKHIFFIKHFHTLQEKMQNKLLKTLEEPFDNVIFVLTCQSLEQVLPTILSRAISLEIDKFSNSQDMIDTAAEWVKQDLDI